MPSPATAPLPGSGRGRPLLADTHGPAATGPDMSCRAREGAAARPVGVTCAPLTSRSLRLLTCREPWIGRVARAELVSVAARPRIPDAVIAIPARDESARIARCLDACLDSITESGLMVDVLVLVNGSRDDTIERVARWSRRRARVVTLVDVDFHPGAAHAGGARSLALSLAAAGVPADTPLLTTDADAAPAIDWVRRNLAHLLGGARLVCGAIRLDEREAARLPEPLTDVCDVTDRYQRATRELEQLLDPDPWNRWPHHGESGGASLALTRATLDAIGGVPFTPCGEDRALAARLRGRGECVRYADDVSVRVSCRLHGRAHGGMADTLRLRLFTLDPPCDAEYREAHRVELDARLAAVVRRLWSRRSGRERLLLSHGMSDGAAARLAGVDEVADVLQDCRAVGSPSRLRVGELRRELPRLLARLERARERTPTCPA